MNFWKPNCWTSLLYCLIWSQAFRLMELYWFVCFDSQSLPPRLPFVSRVYPFILPLFLMLLILFTLLIPFGTYLNFPPLFFHRSSTCWPAFTPCRHPTGAFGTTSTLPQTCWHACTCRMAWRSSFPSENTRQQPTFFVQPARLVFKEMTCRQSEDNISDSWGEKSE